MKNSDSTQQKEEINIQVFDDHTRSKLIRDSNFCNKSAIYTRIFHCPGIKTIFDVQLYMAKEKNTEICHIIILLSLTHTELNRFNASLSCELFCYQIIQILEQNVNIVFSGQFLLSRGRQLSSTCCASLVGHNQTTPCEQNWFLHCCRLCSGLNICSTTTDIILNNS